MTQAVSYLAAIAGAEAVAAFLESPWGILGHVAVMTALIIHSALTDKYPQQQLLLSLALVPLFRIISLSIPLADLPQIWSYFSIYALLLLATVLMVRILDYKLTRIGFNAKWPVLQMVVIGIGFLLGLVGYLILRPEVIMTGFEWHEVWLPAVILTLCAGFIEEFVFRGVIQYGAVRAFGGWGVVYVSLLFAIVYTGFLPVRWVGLAFIISLYFGWMVKTTKSILGVALAHGIYNIAVYLAIPFF